MANTSAAVPSSGIRAGAPAGDAASRVRARRGAIAAWVGSALEFYDFFLYSTASALILAPLFFPKFNPLVGTLAAFTANATAFLVRPVGGLLFGYLGDRVGRGVTLMVTLVLMGVASALVGCLPTYDSIGIAAPILLVSCRLLQGIAQGGEHTGGVLVAFENAPADRRGLYCSWSQSGVAAGFVISSGVYALTSGLAGQQHFLAWAWRIPFIASLVLVALGIWVRRSVFETLHREEPAKRTDGQRHSPLAQVLAHSRREVLISIGLRLIEQAGSYIFMVFGLYYLSTYMHMSRDTILIIAIIGLTADFLFIPVFGWMSDVWGRRRLYMLGAVAMTVWIFPAFWLFQTQNVYLVTLSFVVGMGLCHAMLVGVQVTIIAEMFPLEWRYTGVAVAHEIGTLVAGALTPIIATVIVGYVGGDWGVCLYVVVLGLITIFCTAIAPIPRKVAA